jgi:poly(3-hydroxyoctanoate) depolymerase
VTQPIHATFVPGAAGQGSFWLPVIEHLPANWLARSFDLPGLGTVPARPDVSSYHDLVDLVAASIPAPSVVVAQSMGGFIALELALEYPELVTHLVLVAVAGGIDMSAHGAANWRAEYGASFPSAQPWACEAVPDLTQRLGEIAVPVLLIWATHDRLSPLSVAKAFESGIRGASLLTFETDDHWVARLHAAETAAAIVRLTEENPAKMGYL